VAGDGAFFTLEEADLGLVLETECDWAWAVPIWAQGSVITLICTRHAYLESGHLRFLLSQNTVEQLFLKTPFIKTHAPYSITACVYTLVDPRQPACTYKSTKKGKLLTEHTALGKLTKPFGHAWPVT
jgi:hypothetical protein